MTEIQGAETTKKQVYVTLHGLPLTIELQWPFHRSKTGADFYILQGTMALQNGGGLSALITMQLTLTLKDVLPSLEAKDVEWAVINTLRKAVDTKEIEFLKTAKRIPVQFGSRSWSFKHSRWTFWQATEAEVEQFLQRKVYWQTKFEGSGARVWLADPADAQYMDASTATITDIAAKLAARGLLQLDGEFATATEQLLAQAERIEAEMTGTQQELEKKHAYERG
jgi:hypothetical protein